MTTMRFYLHIKTADINLHLSSIAIIRNSLTFAAVLRFLKIILSEFTWFIKSFVKLLTIKKSFMNWHVMMSEFTCIIKSFVTLLTIKNSFLNWHIMLSQFTCFVKSFITLFTIKRVEVISEASDRPLHRKAFYYKIFSYKWYLDKG